MAVRVLDVHAHITPESALRAMQSGDNWFGVSAPALYNQHRYNPRTFWMPEQRLADMDSLGVDVHVLSTNANMYFYDLGVDQTVDMHRECNDHVARLTDEYPDRFAGLAHLPMQDVGAAIEELTRAVEELGLKGAMIGDHVNGRTFDDPYFNPLWATAERLGAMFLIHQGGGTVVSPRLDRYHLPNTIGNLADRAVTFASFVFGGVMDRYPNLKVCLCHGGGYACYGIGRMDRGWQVRPEARANIDQPPSAYLNRFYYDCLTHSEEGLRMLIDMVGVERVWSSARIGLSICARIGRFPGCWVWRACPATKRTPFFLETWSVCWVSSPNLNVIPARLRHSRASGNPGSLCSKGFWIPAFAGTTRVGHE